MALPTPTPAPLPTGASTATKILFTAAGGAFIVAPIVQPYSATAASLIASLGGAAIAFGGLVHVYWDHSP